MNSKELTNYEKVSDLTFFQLFFKNWNIHLLIYFLSVVLMVIITKCVLYWSNLKLETIIIISTLLSLVTVLFYMLNEKSLLVNLRKLMYPEFITKKEDAN